MVTVAAMMAMTVTAIAFRRLDGGDAEGGQNAGGEEQADTDEAHVKSSKPNCGGTVAAPLTARNNMKAVLNRPWRHPHAPEITKRYFMEKEF